MKIIAVLGTHHPDAMALIAARSDVELVLVEDPEPQAPETAAAIAGVHGIAVRSAKLTGDLLSLAPDLEVVSRHGVGCDSVDVAHLTARGLPMAIATGANTISVIEHVYMLMLGLARQIKIQDTPMQAGDCAARGRAQTSPFGSMTVQVRRSDDTRQKTKLP